MLPRSSVPWGLLPLLALASGCAQTVSSSTAGSTRVVEDVPPVDVPPADVGFDPLDDPTVRIDCPPGIGDPCGPGRHCIATGPGFQGRCVRDGARGGLCRDTRIGCDEEMVCFDGWCDQGNHFAALTLCEATRRCGFEQGCVELEGALRCVRHGAIGGYCRTTGVACDNGATCDRPGNNRGRCGLPRTIGQPCGPLEPGAFCEANATCVIRGATGVCEARGSEGAACLAEDRCNGGLECQLPDTDGPARCVNPLRQGQNCGPFLGVNAPRCAQGLSCGISGASRQGTCRPYGEHLAACRTTGAPCSDGLICVVERNTCLRRLDDGAPCSTSTTSDTSCAAGSSCMITDGRYVCTRDGAQNGRCRIAAMPCDPGLFCNARLTTPTCLPLGP